MNSRREREKTDSIENQDVDRTHDVEHDLILERSLSNERVHDFDLEKVLKEVNVVDEALVRRVRFIQLVESFFHVSNSSKLHVFSLDED